MLSEYAIWKAPFGTSWNESPAERVSPDRASQPVAEGNGQIRQSPSPMSQRYMSPQRSSVASSQKLWQVASKVPVVTFQRDLHA